LRLDPFAPKRFSEQQSAFIKTRNITDGRIPRLNRFHFENFWLTQPGFVEAVNLKWEAARTSTPRVFNAVDVWHHCAKMSRQFMWGWGANLGAELRQRKGLILGRIQDLDAVLRSGFSGMPLRPPLWRSIRVRRCYGDNEIARIGF
jgi:hypothetical protein